MQTETLNDMRQAKRAFEEAKQVLDSMGLLLYGSITDSIQEYNELYETQLVLSIKEEDVKPTQPEKRKPGRPKGTSNLAGANRDKLIAFLQTNGPSSRNEIIAGTKIPDGSFNYTVGRIDCVIKLPDGRYSLSPANECTLVP